MSVLINLVAALSLAFALVAITTFVARSEDMPRLLAWSFALAVVGFWAAFTWVGLPAEMVLPMAGSALVIGGMAAAGRIALHRFERRTDAH